MATDRYQLFDQDGNLLEEREVEVPTEEANERTLRDRADQAIAAMQTHIDRGTFTNAQRDAALLLLLRVCVALVRLVLRRFDAA